MKRIFITINYTKFKGMLKDSPLESRVNEYEILPKKYTLDGVEIIILKDDFANWNNINKNEDGILYHTTSSEGVKNTIHTTFTHVTNSKHDKGSAMHKVFEIILGDGTDKAQKIIDLLFNPKPGMSTGSTVTIQQAQVAYTNLHRNLDSYYNVIKNNNNNDKEKKYIDAIKQNYVTVANYILSFNNEKFKDLNSKEDFNELYTFLQSVHHQVHDFLFKQ